MGLIVKENGGGGFAPVPEGVHRAICYSVYDMGTHFNEKFGKSAHSVLFVWEIPDERIDIERDGETQNLPRAISKKYTLSLNEKANLRKDLQTWRGKSFTAEELAGFDLQKVLGKSCQLQVIHNTTGEKTYANIAAILPLPKGSAPLVPENPTRFYSINDNGDKIPEGTPDWITDIIKDSDEWTSIARPAGDSDRPPDDDIPF
jgi:hypothetical protein